MSSAMNERLKALYAARDRALGAARSVVDAAEKENRSLSGEELSSIQAANADFDAKDNEIRALEAVLANGATVDADLLNRGENRSEKDAESLSDRFRAVGLGEARSVEVEIPANYSARDMSANTVAKSVTASAGTLTQNEFVQQFLSTLTETSSLLSLGPRVLNTPNGNLIEMPRQIGRTAKISRVNEGQTIPKVNGPSFDRVTLAARKYAGIAQISYEMVRDGIIDLSPLLARELGESAALTVNDDLYNGDGVNKPFGLLTRVTNGVTGTAGAAPTFDNLIDLEHSLARKYRSNAAWILNDDTFRVLRHVKDTAGNFIYQPGTRDGAPSTILGRRFATDDNMPTIGAGKKSVLIGDISAYWYRQVQGVRIERSTEYEWENDVISYKAVIYAGGDLFDTSAVKAYAS